MHRSFDTAEKIALCLLYWYGVEAIHDMHNKPLSQRCLRVVAAATQYRSPEPVRVTQQSVSVFLLLHD